MRIQRTLRPSSLVRQESEAGVTLIELMIVIVVMVIIASIAMPSYKHMMISSDAASVTNRLLGTFNHARSEAAKRGMKVVVCKSADGSTCDTVNNWDEGWIEFVDVDGNDARTPASEALIAAQPAVAHFVITGNNTVPYYPTGMSSGTRTISVCNAAMAGTIASRKRNIIIIGSGRARINVVAAQTSCP